MARLLVTGASGLLGANLVLETAARHEVVAVARRHPVRHSDVAALEADLAQDGVAEQVMRWAQPEWVVHCAAATNLDECEADPPTAFRLNRDMAGAVAAAAAKAGARLVHISTDAVFGGDAGTYDETSATRPVNVYGRSKLAGEEAVTQAYAGATVIRTNIYGWNAQAKSSLAEWFLVNLAAGRRCLGFDDVFFTPILVNDLVPVLLAILEKDLRGVYHVAGSECLSKRAFGLRVAENFGLEPGLIESGHVAQAGLLAPRPKKICLDCRRVEAALGLTLPGVDAGLRRFRQLREQGFVQQLKAFSVTHIPGPNTAGL